ncbi:hypothetical protein A8H39_01160 [Paraburkholderia fungorum]|uniref:hypothetical protein n=1 Tax=Paraburkholderia fungorum TaxID=134537 RepID=UPI000697815A|nr:hypothetical protein [Paraburkholderia fungorum]PNE59785.1 hypothetical protein A8H39_01160 [Paraburkholderia fungorum]
MAKTNPREVAQELRDLDRKDVPLRVRAAIEKAITALESVEETQAASLAGNMSQAARQFRYPDVSALAGGADLAACSCETCRPVTLKDMRMVLCPTCGNKRCPHATDHRNACTGSNEAGQKGSSWEHVRPAPAVVTASRQPDASAVEYGGPRTDVPVPVS